MSFGLGLGLGIGDLSVSEIALDAHVMGYGDSLTYTTNADWLERFGSTTGLAITNKGEPGEKAAAIRARLVADLAANPSWRNRRFTIWAGTNDKGDWNDPAYDYTRAQILLNEIATMVAAIGHTGYRILGLLAKDNSSGEYASPLGYRRTQIDWFNSQLTAIYGNRAILPLPLLIAQSNGDGDDTTSVTRGVPPLSLRTDDTHLTKVSSQKVGALTNGSAVILDAVLDATEGDWWTPAAPSTSIRLLEDGASRRLLEDGSFRLLEI